MTKSKFFKYEWFVLLGGLLGLLFGLYLPSTIEYYTFVGTIFISLLKVMLVPFVAVSIFLSFMRISDKGQLKKLGSTTISYYFITSAMAVTIGLIVANLFLGNDLSTPGAYEAYSTANFKPFNFNEFIASFFSQNIFKSFAESSILQIVVFSCFMGLASTALGEDKKKPLLEVTESLFELLMTALHWVLYIAPVGIFALVAKTIATSEGGIFADLGNFFVATSVAIFVHAFITLPLIGKFIGGFNPLQFANQVKQAVIVALSTASSSSTLPVSIQCLEENAGVSKKTAGFVTPLGATLNMDGSALYQALIVLFLAKISGMQISFAQQFIVFFYVMLSSAGTAGIPGGGVVMVGMTLEYLGLPLELLGIYLLVDRFWDYPTTAVNVWGDLIGAKTVDRFLTKEKA
jgi:proton glutamate symport protein